MAASGVERVWQRAVLSECGRDSRCGVVKRLPFFAFQCGFFGADLAHCY